MVRGPVDSLYMTLSAALRVRGGASRADVAWWCVFASGFYAAGPGVIAVWQGVEVSSGVVYAGSALAVFALAVPTTTLVVRRLNEMGRGVVCGRRGRVGDGTVRGGARNAVGAGGVRGGCVVCACAVPGGPGGGRGACGVLRHAASDSRGDAVAARLL